MKRTNVILAASLFVFATSFSACQKSETTDPMVDSSQDDDQITALYDNVQSEADEVVSAPAKSLAESADYAMLMSGSGTRTVVTSFSGDTLIKTITFASFINGNSQNGHIKNGVVVVKVLGGPLQAQFIRIVTLQNFTIDGNKIEGKNVTTKTGEHKYTEVLAGGKITLTDGTTYTREFTHTRTWTAGFDTPLNIWDDVFTIEGNATGINRKGNTYTHTITNPLVIENACRWIVQGTIELTTNGKTATLDYGMGTCDDMATLTINGKTTDIKIRTKR